MDSSIFALNPSLNNDLGSSLKDLGNTIWRVGRPALPCPTLSSKTLTHIFMPTCCLCYSEAHSLQSQHTCADYAMARAPQPPKPHFSLNTWILHSSLFTFPLTNIRQPPRDYSNLPKTIASRKTRDTAFRLAFDKKLSFNLKNFSNYEDRMHSKFITLQKKKDQTVLTPKSITYLKNHNRGGTCRQVQQRIVISFFSPKKVQEILTSRHICGQLLC